MQAFKGTFGGYEAKVSDGVESWTLTTKDGVRGIGYDCVAILDDHNQWHLIVTGLGTWDVVKAKEIHT